MELLNDNISHWKADSEDVPSLCDRNKLSDADTENIIENHEIPEL